MPTIGLNAVKTFTKKSEYSWNHDQKYYQSPKPRIKTLYQRMGIKPTWDVSNKGTLYLLNLSIHQARKIHLPTVM
jgi:hypothetical protein